MKLNEVFEVHNELNPKLWDGAKLRPEVHDKIIEIVEEFIKFTKLPMKILDVQLVGSNASYNYTDSSDLDVHIITNFDGLSKDKYVVQTLYNLEKSSWKSKYDIHIHGVEIELYVEDIESGVTSNGIYSVLSNEWIKSPKMLSEVPVYNVSFEVFKWEDKIQAAIDRCDVDELQGLLDRLYMMRKNSIAIDGEYGRGNQIFKELRTLGVIQKIKDTITRETEKKLSLESLSNGEIVNYIDENNYGK